MKEHVEFLVTPRYIILSYVTPQVRHPERVFLREGSPECGMIWIIEKTLENYAAMIK